MRRALALAAALVTIPASTALGADLEELLERNREASYSAEQIITCSTPDGVVDAVVRLSQAGGELQVGAPVDTDLSVSSGDGGWTLLQGGDVVSSTAVEESEGEMVVRYTVDEGMPIEFLGRQATRYLMLGDDLVRAELTTDNEIGALLKVVTYGSGGEVYCERRFITFDTTAPAVHSAESTATETLRSQREDSDLPEELAGFARLDTYSDDQGFVFSYYSDGFFSFAVFETPSVVSLVDPSTVDFGGSSYGRVFAPGQVTYSWESRSGGMALIGDLPPDMHQAVLEGLPEPYDPGVFRRLWRTLFG